MERLSSRERIMRTIEGRPVDRIPIWSLLPWNPLSAPPEAGDWKAEPAYQEVLAPVREHCDFAVDITIPERGPSSDTDEIRELKRKMTYGGIFDRRFFLVPPETVDGTVEHLPDGTAIMRFVVHTPRGDLTTVEAVYPNDETIWDIEPLVKSVEDAEKLLAAPYRFDPPDLSDYYAKRARLGDAGITSHFISTPLVMVSQVTGFQTFLEWTISEPRLVERLVGTAYERVAERLAYLLARDTGPLFHFGGCEQATPPMMSRRFFDRFVLGYDRKLWQMTREAGKMVWVHCHGKIATVLDAFVDGGVQMLDPVEPPPQGDIDLLTAKQRVATCGMTLIGGLQWAEFVTWTPTQVEEAVRRAICDGGKQHYILSSTAGVQSPVASPLCENLGRYIEAGLKYGAM